MTYPIRIHQIQPVSVVDGPGQRTVVFFQGCSLHCPGCQNRHLWPADQGYLTAADDLALTLAALSAHHGNLTISGGEPFDQPIALAALLDYLRPLGRRHILVYTGYTWSELFNPLHPAFPWLKCILERIDILVDGRFVLARDDPFLSWRGSRNQRPIDVPASLAAGAPVILDWDAPEIILDPHGDIHLPVGLAADFAALGPLAESRRCGQTT